MICTLFVPPGSVVCVEEPSYFLALNILADHRLRVVSLPTDEHGLIVDGLAERLAQLRPAMLYLIPAFQNPSGATLARDRRERLVELIRQYDFLIVADEVYHFLSYTVTPPPSFGAHIDDGHVLALGSFSKILAPGLRLGWVQAQTQLVQRMVLSGLLDSGGGLIEARLVEPEIMHFCLDALTDVLQLSIHAGNGNDITQELDDILAVCFNSFLDSLDCHIYLAMEFFCGMPHHS